MSVCGVRVKCLPLLVWEDLAVFPVERNCGFCPGWKGRSPNARRRRSRGFVQLVTARQCSDARNRCPAGIHSDPLLCSSCDILEA